MTCSGAGKTGVWQAYGTCTARVWQANVQGIAPETGHCQLKERQ